MCRHPFRLTDSLEEAKIRDSGARHIIYSLLPANFIAIWGLAACKPKEPLSAGPWLVTAADFVVVSTYKVETRRSCPPDWGTVWPVAQPMQAHAAHCSMRPSRPATESLPMSLQAYPPASLPDQRGCPWRQAAPGQFQQMINFPGLVAASNSQGLCSAHM